MLDKNQNNKIGSLNKNTVLPISLGLVMALIIGVWVLAVQVSKFTTRMETLEKAVKDGTSFRWTFLMERETWETFGRDNPDIKLPDIKEIRKIYQER